ncbi:hypothetical protein OUZ56_012733 [Daphnia magna]|uniref:Uncharacterized protein n=1 Tax=Daphnia magna TaxID=35525 RepID=A0ABQ9Z3W0_9CRUS|nr:hypothetical protein OUZ56_012733 [Daphnia magna]
MTKETYNQILIRKVVRKSAVPGGLKLLSESFTFQEDNDPTNAFTLCRGVLKRMIWPPQSLD